MPASVKPPDWAQEYLQMIEDCEDRESRCSEWELSFLESISAQIATGKHLTKKQTDVLDGIWEKATARG